MFPFTGRGRGPRRGGLGIGRGSTKPAEAAPAPAAAAVDQGQPLSNTAAPDMETSNPSSPERKEDGNNVQESRSSSPNNDQILSNPSSETKDEETE